MLSVFHLLTTSRGSCREKALPSVKIRQEEVDIIALEFEVDRKTATKALRDSRGDLTAALESFL